MKAIVCERLGPLEQGTHCVDIPEPVPGEGELCIETRAMSVNFPDWLQPQGLYQWKPALPFVLGMEFAGIVRRVGEACRRFKPGDRVAGMNHQGAFAEVIVAPERTCYALPEDIDYEAAATLPLAGGAAMYALTRRGALRAGETLAVLGAAGGTGLAAVQIGHALGARVIAVCSSDEKVKTARGAGADEAIVSGREDLSDRLKVLTAQRGVDVLYDTVGGAAFDAASRCMAWNGRLLVVGFASGTIPQLATNLALVKGYALVGVHWAAALEKEPDLVRAVVAEVFDLHRRGGIVPVIDARVPLAEGVAAIRRLGERRVQGKVILYP